MISLEKRSQVAQEVLINLLKEQPTLEELNANGVLAIDYSGSMYGEYKNGAVQDLSERALGLMLSGLDDDGKVQVFPFHHEALEHFELDKTNYSGAIETWRKGGTPEPPARKKLFGRSKPSIRPDREMGGTDYLPAIDAIMSFCRAKGMLAPGQPPVLVIFQTDGGTTRPDLVKARLTAICEEPVFWMFCGTGYNTEFLADINAKGDKKIDNVGFCSVVDILKEDEKGFYEKLTREFATEWIPAVRAAGILKDLKN